MKKIDVVHFLLKNLSDVPQRETATAFAPTNIALCKYWGKRNQELNLPVTSSLSVSLNQKGAAVKLKINSRAHDVIFLNDQAVDLNSEFSQKLISFLNLFRAKQKWNVDIEIKSNIPIAAGLASSACGFASLVLALNELFQWNLSSEKLSILARLGSGSASRSIEHGFIEWHAGKEETGMDSYSKKLAAEWPELCVGLCIVNDQQKEISSREAMQRTIETSQLYSAWPEKVSHDLISLKEAIASHDFELLGRTAESNAIAMHATMMDAHPPIIYSSSKTLHMMQKIWELRAEGLSVFFTQDAGPNLKLLFLKKDEEVLKEKFSMMEIIEPFVMPACF